MTRRIQCLTAALALCASSGASAAEPPPWKPPEGVNVSASAAPGRVTVGDRIIYTLSAAVPEGTTVTFPPVGRTAGDFRVCNTLPIPPAALKNGWRRFSRAYDLRVYETGEKIIPSAPIVLRNSRGQTAEVDAGRIVVAVESVLDGEPKDIKDIKPPVPLSFFPAALLAWGAAAVAAAVAAVLLARRMKRTRKAPPPPPPPAHVIAYRELQELLAMNLIAQGRVKEYYILLSDIVRRYIGRRFGLRAPDMTTEEFLAEAAEASLLDARSRTLVGDFLEQCDMVKFARYGPGGEEISGAHAAARRFVDETKEGAAAPAGR